MLEYGILVQARLGSTRLPKKILERIRGRRVLDHVLDACIETQIKTTLVVPEQEVDFFRKNFNIEVFGGSEKDVLSRFYDCAKLQNLSNVIRITSDCPALNSKHIDKIKQIHEETGGFVTNVAYDAIDHKSLTSIPDGFDIEIFDFKSLEDAHKNAVELLDREHVTRWMRNNCRVTLLDLYLKIDEKFSLDTKHDLERIDRYFDLLKKTSFREIK